ncbi:hypothetical protein EUX54_03255 [Haemophilus haemolyticus]|jgi:lipoprotein|uniref:Lipoprotein n=1 Tax=Haemophilus haemolyticus TaxID=726 RepID=A0A502JPD2_HAEHA|nr:MULTISPECIES: hypothetical protein [Haemophilus]MBS6047176.1 hypothetical protein [Haemophilus haemolyticus]MDK7281162.1 hypothetical protein [Haemophilus seminalis]TPH01090.1 hypothetical protein EUX54_03255 [Haemophilus haemolyticus]
MKKLLICTLIVPMLFACATERKSIAQINAERNNAQAYVTTESLEQQRMQRQNELEESILRRQQDRMENQSTREKVDTWLTPILGIQR